MDEQDGNRGTGYFGTGVYFYVTKQGREDDRAYGAKEQPGVDMKCACRKPFKLKTWDEGVDFHNFSRDMMRSVKSKDQRAPTCRLALSEGLGISWAECNQRSKDAVEATRRCLVEAGTPWAPYCTQPINHLLGDLGFDCVYPLGEMGDDNSFGAVILKEAIDECVGVDIRGGNPYGMTVWKSKEAEDDYKREMRLLEQGFERCFIRGER
jgi:hypothetical protein